MKQPELLVITGPTASGKTALAVAAAEMLNGEIISADSMQIYRGMDIGTAKVTPEEAHGIPHYMVDVADPSENWSAARWTEMADECVQDILSRGKLPIVAGGTGLYIDSLLSGREYGASPENTGLREKLNKEYDAMGGEYMLEHLRLVDPERAARLAPADRKRVVRALEVYLLTGETITEHDRRTKELPPRYTSLRFALTWDDRTELYRRIDLRVDHMMEQGLENEVRSLLAEGLSVSCTAMQAIGYKETAAAIRGDISREEAVLTIKRESRRYAKRQLTWFRRDGGLRWLIREQVPHTEDALRAVCSSWREAFQ